MARRAPVHGLGHSSSMVTKNRRRVREDCGLGEDRTVRGCGCLSFYIHTCIHTYIHAYIHTYLLTYIHTCLHTCIHTYIHTITYIQLVTYS